MGKRTTGMVLGKFMPPHLGHKYLIDFARHCVEDLTVVVGTLASEPIPGHLRYQWMRELFPGVRVVHLTDENPQYPHEHPDFWQIWHDSLRRVMPEGPDYVFASEEYGWKLAEILGARFVPVDIARNLLPISATAVREDPYKNWSFIPTCVRPYFLKRICIFGPESTGKSTLALQLAEHFETPYVGEYARGYLEAKKTPCEASDIPQIARGQMASEDAIALAANRVLICDTDILTTTIWSRVLFGGCPEWILEEAGRRRYDLYLFCDTDLPWVADPIRYPPEGREAFKVICQEELANRGLKYVKITGTGEERFEMARRAVEGLFARL